MKAKDLALGSNEDVNHVGIQEPVPCQLRPVSQTHSGKPRTSLRARDLAQQAHR